MLIESLRKARKVSTPIIAVTTADQNSTIDTIRDKILLNGQKTEKEIEEAKDKYPIIKWDTINGFKWQNPKGRQALDKIGVDPMTIDAASALSALNHDKLPDHSIIIIVNAGRTLGETPVVQAIMNLRDPFKRDRKTLILLGAEFQLPPELTHDILILDEPLPTEEEVKTIIKTLYDNNKVVYDAKLLDKCVDACRGLAVFPIEQAASLSVELKDSKPVVNIEELWHRKKKMIQQVKGLTMENPKVTFADMGGLLQIKNFAAQLFAGPRKPKVICFIDEIEKAMAGSNSSMGDSSGTSQDQLGVILSGMEDHGFPGQICVGPPGSGKSFYARLIAGTYGVPLVVIDLGACKGSLVGQSEQQIRAMMKAVVAIAGEGGAFFVATCNRLDSLPPELRRRFRFGLWFFDLADEEERISIGKIQTAKIGVKNDPDFWKSADGFSGANIRDVSELAYAMNLSLEKASEYIVPAAKQDPQSLDRLRNMAEERFLSASKPGVYHQKSEKSPKKMERKLDV